MNMNMYVYRVAEKQDSGSAGEPGENHPNGRSWLTTALSPALPCFRPVEVYPSLASGSGRQGVRIASLFGSMDTSRPGL